MKKTLLALVLLVIAAPVFAQTTAQKDAVRTTLIAEVKKYSLPTTKEQQGVILDKVAGSHPGWVMLGKKNGNNCPAPSGELVSCDFLVYAPTQRGWDVLFSEGTVDMRVVGPEGDGYDMAGAIADGSRSMVYPSPGVVIGGPDVELPPATEVVDLTPLENRIKALEALVQTLSEAIESYRKAGLQMITEAQDKANTADAKASTVRDYLLQHPIPDGCKVVILGCRPSFNYPPLQ